MDPISFIAIVGGSLFVILTLYFGWRQANPPEENKPSTRTYIPPSSSSNQTHINYKSNYIQQQKEKRDLETVLYQRVIERFNTHYDLGLYDGDIYEISRSPSPWETLEEYVTPGTPSIEESIDSLIRTAHTLAHGIGLDENTTEDLESSMLSFIDELFETGDYEESLALYTLSEDNCTPETHYLIGKINYFAIILSLIDFYADKNDNDFLKRKCEEIAEKNQSIF